ncbi:MAG: hypothetical protein FJY73_06625 [Candidatus Eisenbacteria bacterium]|nr:hypothetical protein [Candidatus Eisenbacteria bacterium]
MKGYPMRWNAFLAGLVLAAVEPPAEGRGAVALQSSADGTVRNWRPEEGNLVVGGHERTWWTASGEAWELTLQGTWNRAPTMDLPVPIASVRLLSENVLFTVDDDVWHLAEEGWIRADRFPR